MIAFLDDIDRLIVQHLLRDGRMSVAELARKVDLSTTACRARKERLEHDGVIIGYTALTNKEIDKHTVTKYIITKISPNRQKNLAGFADFLSRIPEVNMFSQLEGEYDFIIRVVCSDQRTYENVHLKINSYPDLIGIHTYGLIRSHL